MMPQTVFKYALLIFFSGFFANSSFSQAPQGINYQAVARDSQTGLELSNQEVFLSAKIRLNGPSGSIVYQENHENISTNEFGLFSLQIGGGESVQGEFSSIDWSAGTHWLEIDIDAGNGLETLGAMQFVSVPYALFAENTGNVDDADSDPQNELVQSLNYNPEDGNLTLNQAGTPLSVNIGISEENNDNDPTNELINEIVFDNETAELSILEADQTFNISLQGLVNDADSDPQNELISSVQLLGNNLVIEEAETWSVSLAQLIDDADANPANELIDTDGLSLNDGVLSISEAGTIHNIDLSPLIDDEDWQTNDANDKVFVESKEVGIGTSDPDALLEIVQATNSDDELLKVVSSEINPVFRVSSNAVSIGTNNPTSNFDVNGSVSFHTTVLGTATQSSYVVQPDDHIIVVRFTSGGADPFTVTMPDASTCEGRVISVTRIGQVNSDNLIFNFGSRTYDFTGDNTYTTDGFLNRTNRFISIGTAGWIRINEI